MQAPEWHDCFVGNTNHKQGQLLLSFQIIPHALMSDERMAAKFSQVAWPKTNDCTIDFTVFIWKCPLHAMSKMARTRSVRIASVPCIGSGLPQP